MRLILCLMYYPGEVMPIEHDVDREDTIEDVDADNGDEMEKTPEAGQSRRRAPGLARFHGIIGLEFVCCFSIV